MSRSKRLRWPVSARRFRNPLSATLALVGAEERSSRSTPPIRTFIIFFHSVVVIAVVPDAEVTEKGIQDKQSDLVFLTEFRR